MKTRNFLLITTALLVLLPYNGIGQKKAEKKNVIITFEWFRIPGTGSNQLAVWVEDRDSNLVKTLYATKFTATGGYKLRPVSLSEWVKKSALADAAQAEIDAFSGSTPPAGFQTITWDCTDKTGNHVKKGNYVIRMEANILNDKKMFYRGEIKISGKIKTGTGEITYSNNELANGNVLFRNVVVTSK